MTQDFLKHKSAGAGAADAAGTLREHMAKFEPETALANAEYSFYKKANDVFKAAAEVERTRPKVGRQIMARLTGAVVGGQTAGALGAAGGFVMGPLLEGLVGSGATTKLQTAKVMQKLADAIEKGDLGHVTSLVEQLKAAAKKPARAAQAGVLIDQQQPEIEMSLRGSSSVTP